MIIDLSIIEACITKAKQNKIEPEKLKNEIGEGDRLHHTTLEQREQMFKNLIVNSVDQTSAHKILERIMGGNDLTSINYLVKGLNVARSVCRVHLKNQFGQTTGFGTGFLVGPNIMITNHHVIRGIEDARGALAEFDYELDIFGNEKTKATFEILTDPAPIAIQHLDFCLVRLSSQSTDGRINLNDFGWLQLNSTPGKTAIGQYLTIIQHPGGEHKQLCVRENKLLKYDPSGNTLWYATDTIGGSSGSPVFNDAWQVVALHHSGIPKTDKHGNWLTLDNKIWDSSIDESRIAWIANEGMRISQIFAFLNANFEHHELARVVLAKPIPPIFADEKSQNGKNMGIGIHRTEYSNGEMQVTIPVQISVRVGDHRSSSTIDKQSDMDSSASNTQYSDLSNTSDLMEKVDVDQTNYNERTGYDPEFLGIDNLQVPLPIVKDKELKSKVFSYKRQGKNETEIRYWNYSVMMHKSRKLAICSAANINMNLRPDKSGRNGDKWYDDPRVSKDNETNASFYGEQKTFETHRSENPFDRGHLTRRVDVQWGINKEIAKRNGDDSFHWTNCAPQYWRFNQGSKRWLGLEDFVIKTYSKETGCACVINGPVFDAPLSSESPDGRITPNFDGKSHKDPTFGDVAIPKMFFKIVSVKDNCKLKTAAFLLSQEEYLRNVDRIKGMPPQTEETLTPSEARLYQVKITDLEKITGLDFGPLKDTIVSGEEEETHITSKPKIIRSFDDVQLT